MSGGETTKNRTSIKGVTASTQKYPFRKGLILSGLYTAFFVGLPLGIPGLLEETFNLLNFFGVFVSGGGAFNVPQDSANQLFINAVGILQFFVGFLIVYSAFNLRERGLIVLFVGLGRLLFSLYYFYYFFYGNIPLTLGIPVLFDILLALYFLYIYRQFGLLEGVRLRARAEARARAFSGGPQV